MHTLLRCAAVLTAFGLLHPALPGQALADGPLTEGHPKSTADVQPGKTAPADRKAAKQAKNKAKAAGKRAAEKRPAEKRPAEGPAKKRVKLPAEVKSAAPDATADVDREAAALALVREHHPDLVELLKRLKETKQKEYQQAVKELYRESQRLEVARQRDPGRYELELRAWQLDSRIRLLTAKLSIADRTELQEDLKAALAERAEVRLAQKRLERERLTARLKKLDEEINNFAATRDSASRRAFDRLLRAAEKARTPERRTGGETEGRSDGVTESGKRPKNQN